VFVDVELGPGEGVARVRERVTQEELTDAVVVVSISGEGEPVTPATVEEAAAEAGALTTRVSDRRELADERDADVSFADPDDAVRDRVRDLGLSPAARDLDETVRASKVADSNVASEVERRVRDLVENGETDAFRPAGEADSEAADTSEAADGGEPADGGTDGKDSGDGDSQVTMEDYL
jgi:hypothetical protein